MSVNRRKLYHRLIQQQRELEEARDQLQKGHEGESLRERTGELSVLDNHPGDVSESMDASIEESLRKCLEREIQQIQDALKAIEEGCYGQCQECGGTIEENRLEALPHSRLCIDCAKAREEEKYSELE